MLRLLLALLQQDSAFVRAEALLAARNYPAAQRIAERLVARRPGDPAAHMLLGRIHLARPVVGRYEALAHFRRAAALAPGEPEPLYGQVEVGRYLKSDEGEGLVREAVLRIFLLAPDYRDCWEAFEGIYHDDAIWRRADLALARHAADPTALTRRARIALALAEPDRADSLAALAMARRPHPDLANMLLRAEAGFVAGRDAAGHAWYDSALVYADLDSTNLLWDQVWMIASPLEAERYLEVPQGQLGSFFEWFWGRRDPNLVTPTNERIAEHFQRLAYVRRQFHLLHPYNAFHWSAARRAVSSLDEREWLRREVSTLPGFYAGGSTDSVRAAMGLGPDIRAANDFTRQRSQSSLAGFDARGLIWIRHGKPKVTLQGALDPARPIDQGGLPGFWLLDNEGWLYETDAGVLTVGFHRATAPGGEGGDYVITPATARQAVSGRILMTTDRSSLPATLQARGWSAFFLGDVPGTTAFYVRTAPESVAVVLWDSPTGNEAARVLGAGLVGMAVVPGHYDLGLDVDSGGAVGRIRQGVHIPAFSAAVFGLSSLVLAAGDRIGDRALALGAMPATLEYAATAPLTTYAEIYGLASDAARRSRYLVRYRLDGPGRPTEIEFTREARAAPAMPEQLVIPAGRLRRGHYRVSVTVTDLLANVKVESATTEITVR